MAYWLLMLGTVLLIPLSMLGFGTLFVTNPPKDINSLFGYRTAMSMKNMDTWQYAHHYCGRLWCRIALVLAPVSCISFLVVRRADISVIGTVGCAICVLQLIPLALSIYFTEKALKRTFDLNGTRK